MNVLPQSRAYLALLTTFVVLTVGAVQGLFSPCFWTGREPCPELHPWAWMPVGTLLTVGALSLVRMSSTRFDDARAQLAVVAAGVLASLTLGLLLGFPAVFHPFTSYWAGVETPPITAGFWLVLLVPFLRSQWLAYATLFASGLFALQDVIALLAKA